MVHRTQEILLPFFVICPKNGKEQSFNALDVRRCFLAYLDMVATFWISDALCLFFLELERVYKPLGLL